MQNPLVFYTQEKQLFEIELTAIKKKLALLSILRLFVFAIISLSVYYFLENTKVVIPLVVFGIAVFLFLVSKHTNLKHTKKKLLALIKINVIEINILNKNKSGLESGSEYKNEQHEYSYDIDLFGEGSFFQYLNRTATKSGKNKLATILTKNTITSIKEKQNGLKELAQKPKWRQNFSAIASLVHLTIKTDSILKWLQKHQSSLPKIMAFLPTIFLVISISLFALNYIEIIAFKYLIIWFFIGAIISIIYVKKVTVLYTKATQAKDTFTQYYQLLKNIESENFTAQILINKQLEIKTESKKASEIFNVFSKNLNALDQRNNVFVAILGNAFALRDIKYTYKIEQWIEKYQHQVEKWFEVIAFFDAQNSLANYVFNHPKHHFANINQDDFTIQAKNLGHPLLDKNKRIDNDFTIKNQDFFIITGANMAGKSTFLRTISLSIVMSNVGLPVCAASFEYSPIKLITSMRTSDSLSDDESYFFSELKRLKFIVDEIKTEKYFIILDEILKGTNSTDKAIGSRKFVEKLVTSNSTGIIATHDLSLCEISNELKQIKNYYFDAEIINDELHFDYTFKDGICQNMNASFLLKKMKII